MTGSTGRLPRGVCRAPLSVIAFAASLVVLPRASSAEDFYKGKQINFVVSSDAAGSYDGFARMISRHLYKYIPGQPSIVVQNMPGAGGLRATNWLYNVAPKDGLTIGMINNTLAFDPLYDNKQAQFEAEKFNWLGTPSQETGLMIVWHTVPVSTIEEAKTRQLAFAASGSASTPAFFARVLSNIFDLKIRIIAGYKSQTDSFLAMERGENDGNASPFWSSLKSVNPTWISEKKIKVLTYYGAARNPEIPGPYVFDLITDPEKKAIMEIAQAGLVMGRPIAMPPGVDADKVELLRTALDATLKDPAYLAECNQMRLDCSQPKSGADLLQFVRTIYGSPKSAVEKIGAIYMEGRRG